MWLINRAGRPTNLDNIVMLDVWEDDKKLAWWMKARLDGSALSIQSYPNEEEARADLAGVVEALAKVKAPGVYRLGGGKDAGSE